MKSIQGNQSMSLSKEIGDNKRLAIDETSSGLRGFDKRVGWFESMGDFFL